MKKNSSSAKINKLEPSPSGVLNAIINSKFLAQEGFVQGIDLISGIETAEAIVESLVKTIDERIETGETLKKIPQYNADMAVEQCF